MMHEIDMIPAAVLVCVLVSIAVRQVGSIRLAIWQIMLSGACAVLLAGSISPVEAVEAIDIDVMLFLSGMFVVGEAMVESGYLGHLAHGLFRRARSVDTLVLSVLFIMGFFSAFLMNDTIAIIATPLVLFFADRHAISGKLMLLALCFAATIGSVASPIGNPQNLLIAIGGGIQAPFVTFFKWLFVPTVINLFAAYGVLRAAFRGQFHSSPVTSSPEPVKDPALAAVARRSLIIVFAMVAFKALAVTVPVGLPDVRLTWIAVAAAAPILIASPARWSVLRRIDWHTLVFFAAMFVLMSAVWRSHAIDGYISGAREVLSLEAVLASSVLLSQVLSNVPFVALYLPVIAHLNAPVEVYMALAAGSTIAGNLFILGAASNVIVIQNAEKRGAGTLGFLDFARAGVPLTAINVAVYWAYFTLMRGL